MSKIEQIDYHANCPSCGAPGNGKEVCEFCGTSLVRQKLVMNSATNVEEIFLQEDSGIPVVHGKLGNVSSFLKIFSPMFGGIFLLVPTVLFASFLATGMLEVWTALFFGIFWVIGIGSFVPLIRAVLAKRKCANGRVVQGIVRGYEDGGYLINNKPVQVMRVRIEDESGPKIVLLNTGETKRDYAVGSSISLRNNDVYYQFVR